MPCMAMYFLCLMHAINHSTAYKMQEPILVPLAAQFV